MTPLVYKKRAMTDGTQDGLEITRCVGRET